MNLLLRHIAEQTKEMREAERLGILARRVINYVIKYVEGYIEGAVPPEFESLDHKTAIETIVNVPNNLEFINISHVTGTTNTFFSVQPSAKGINPDSSRMGQYIEKNGNKFIVVYDSYVEELLNDIKEISRDNLKAPSTTKHEGCLAFHRQIAMTLKDYQGTVAHELVHLSDKINMDTERQRIAKATVPFKVRMGADPAEHMEDLSNAIAKTREQLYYRNEHEIRAHFLPAVQEVTEQVRDGLYVLPKTYSEFIQEFNTIFCPEMRKFDDSTRKNLEKKLFNIYSKLKKIAK